MKAAARLVGRVARLVLLETNPFYLLAQSGRVDAFAEAMELRNYIKKFGALGEWATAAEKFADYWGGAGTWREMSLDRRIAFAEALKPNFFEWDAVMNETTPVEQWATLLPGATLLVCDPRTVLPIREITAVLRRSCPGWAYKEVPGAGHMAPLTRPDLINPLVASFLGAPANNEGVIELAEGELQITLEAIPSRTRAMYPKQREKVPCQALLGMPRVWFNPRYCGRAVVSPLCRCPRQLWAGGYPSSASSKRGSFCRLARVSGESRRCPANQGFSGELCNLQRSLRVLWYRGDVGRR